MLSFRVQAELADDETAVGFVVFVSRDERNAITLAKVHNDLHRGIAG